MGDDREVTTWSDWSVSEQYMSKPAGGQITRRVGRRVGYQNDCTMRLSRRIAHAFCVSRDLRWCDAFTNGICVMRRFYAP
eukprot:959263-Pyramimonas_sp.AAC.3